MEFTEFIAGIDDNNRRLDKIIRKFIENLQLSQIYSLIRKGLIKVNQKKAKPEQKIFTNDVIKVASFILKNTEQKISCIDSTIKEKTNSNKLEEEVVFKNDHLIIINKEYDTLVHGRDDSIEKKIKNYYNSFSHDSLSFLPGPLHRLDKKTSGLLTFSWSLQGASWFSENIKTHAIKKTYIGIVEGILNKEEYWTDYINTENKISQNNFYKVKISNNKEDNSKKSETIATPILNGKFNNKNYTLVKFNIKTGRTHQIRAQSYIHGYPLLGDTAYNGTKTNLRREFFLHAIKLSFPEQNELNLPLEIKTAFPEDFYDFLNKTINDKILLNKKIECIL